jgi:ATP-dependent DNA helicase RecG
MTELSHVSVTALKGVGEAMAEKLSKVGLENIQDVLFHLPGLCPLANCARARTP